MVQGAVHRVPGRGLDHGIDRVHGAAEYHFGLHQVVPVQAARQRRGGRQSGVVDDSEDTEGLRELVPAAPLAVRGQRVHYEQQLPAEL